MGWIDIGIIVCIVGVLACKLIDLGIKAQNRRFATIRKGWDETLAEINAEKENS